MQGYQMTFLTCPSHRHRDKPLAQWLFDLARDMGLCGATLCQCGEDYDQQNRPHAGYFPKLAEQTMEVRITATAEKSAQFFERLRLEEVHVFYVKTPIEFGMLGESA